MTGETVTQSPRPEDEIDSLLGDVKPVWNDHWGYFFRQSSRRLEDGSSVSIAITDRGGTLDHSLHYSSPVDQEGYVEIEGFSFEDGSYHYSRIREEYRWRAFSNDTGDYQEQPIDEAKLAKATDLIEKFKAASLSEEGDRPRTELGIDPRLKPMIDNRVPGNLTLKLVEGRTVPVFEPTETGEDQE